MRKLRQQIEIEYKGKPAKVRFEIPMKDLIKAQNLGFEMEHLTRVHIYILGVDLIQGEEETRVFDCQIVVEKDSAWFSGGSILKDVWEPLRIYNEFVE